MKVAGIFASVVIAINVSAQDMHFSQFQEHPSLLNPALTGITGRVRASAAYKDQWKSVTMPYRTMGATVEMARPAIFRRKREGKFGTSLKKNPGKLAVGLSVYRDRAGDGYLGLTQGNLSLATILPAGKRSYLSAGLQASYAQRRVDPTALVFPSQYGGTGYDPGISSGEDFAGDRSQYTDFAAGLLWTYGQDEKTFVTHTEVKAKLGASVYHIMEPGRQFLPVTFDPLARKYLAHGDLLFSLGPRAGISTAFLYQLQGGSSELTAGAMYRFYMQNTTKYTGFVARTVIGGGAYYRNGDAAIVSLLLEWDERYALGVSYDINFSNLSSASGFKGGMEISLRYSPPGGFLYEHR
jgi:type IX secretion system PorP/SprF family membrane protein